MHALFTPPSARARVRARALTLATVVALLAVLIPATAGIALGHSASVAASATCTGVVEYTVTDWTTVDTIGQADATFTISYAINGSSNYTPVTTAASFSSADSWFWSGSFTPSSPYTSLSLEASNFVWGDKGNYPGPWYATATLPTGCQPALSTTPSPSTGGKVGVTLTDTAILSGAFNPTGTITFDLYGPDNLTCSGDPIYTYTASDITGDGRYSTPTGFTTTAKGTYDWSVSYSGDDSGNSPASAGCGEPEVVTAPPPAPSSPSLTTTPSAGGEVGVTLTDTAILAGGSTPTGSIVFGLYGPDNLTCSGDPIYTYTASDITGDGSYSTPLGFTTTAAGTYEWTASYSGDDSNKSATSACGAETVVVPARTPSPVCELKPWLCSTPTPTPPTPTPPTPTPPTPTPPTPTPPTPTPTQTGSVAGATGTPAPSVPPTSTLGGDSGSPSGSSLLLLLGALGAASLALVVATRLRGRLLEHIER